MGALLLVSHFALWVFVLIQATVTLLVLRQVGLLHLRIGPSGARVMNAGPEIGAVANPFVLRDMDNPDAELSVSTSMQRDLLLLFISPNCAVCAELIPAIHPIVRETHIDLDCAIVGLEGLESCRRLRKDYGLHTLFFAHEPTARDHFSIPVTPYGILLQTNGRVVAKGLVNHSEHLESLLNIHPANDKLQTATG